MDRQRFQETDRSRANPEVGQPTRTLQGSIAVSLCQCRIMVRFRFTTSSSRQPTRGYDVVSEVGEIIRILEADGWTFHSQKGE